MVPGNCRVIQEQLDTHARGPLGPDQRGLVEQHLRGCADCRQSLALERLLVSARSAAGPPAPAGLAGEVVRAWVDQRPRDRLWRCVRAGQRAAVGLACCALVDPFLQVDYQVRGVLEQVCDMVLAPLHLVGATLQAELASAGRLALAPLQHGGALIYRLAGGNVH